MQLQSALNRLLVSNVLLTVNVAAKDFQTAKKPGIIRLFRLLRLMLKYRSFQEMKNSAAIVSVTESFMVRKTGLEPA